MVEPTSSALIVTSGIAAKKIVEVVVNDLYSLGKQEFGTAVKEWKAAAHMESIYKRVRRLRLVKTIFQTEREIDLTAFYYPSRVLVSGKKSVVHRLSDLHYDGNVLIEGTVGQGKSIFLRYVAAVEFCVTRRVPVFVELRRMRQGQTIMSLALQELKTLGFEMTEELFHFFADKGRLLLLLDAFDEVKEELRQDVVTEVENLGRQHEALRIVMTSRPNSGVANSAAFRVFRLALLDGREYEHVIRKMANDDSTADAIIGGIRKEATQIAPLLSTPLMVALLLVRYRIDQSLPQNEASFYDELFSLLLQRHDKTKAGYVRPRKSQLSDAGLEEFFNALAFVTRKAHESSFSRRQLNERAAEAGRLAEAGVIEKALADIVDITCMILADGDEARFIHKSVQEYHAALFIKRQPDDSATAFYAAMDRRWNSWAQELRFLSTIDRYRY